MKRIAAGGLLAVCIVLSGCATTSDTGTAQQSSSRSPVLPTPSATPSNPSPSPTSQASDSSSSVSASPAPSAPPAESHAVPVPQESDYLAPPRPLDEVDPVGYVSHAIDRQNGNVPLPGVEFRSEDGRIVCGIITVGHFTTTPGTASCTVDTFADILPQPYPDTGPYVQSVMVTPYMGASHLYPNWFGYPERSIPVVPAGMSIRYEGTRCTVSNDDVTCRVTATGEGFTLSPGGFTFH